MWKDLTLRQRAHLISEGVKAGIGNAVTIKKLYDQQHTFDDGGSIYDYGYNSWVDLAKDVIKLNEGWRNLPYKDGKGLYSIGWGFNDSGFRSKYPMGISLYYKNGITLELAELELNWYLGNAINHLLKYYGSKWNLLSDYLKVALLDTYYLRPASIINSTVRDAIINDDPNAYALIGVQGYDNRNNSRRAFFQNTGMPAFIRTLTPEQREMLQYQIGNSRAFGTGMDYNLPEVTITADRPTVPAAESDIKLAPYENVAGIGSLKLPEQEDVVLQTKEETPILALATRQMPPDLFDASLDYDDNDYNTFKGVLRSDLVKQENKIKRMHDMEMAMYNQRMSDINNNIILTDMYGNPLLARGGSIHIDPENRGKFNETKRRTGKTTEELTHSSNPLTRKRAIFALNAAKWNHDYGGYFDPAKYYAALAAMYPERDGEHLTITDTPDLTGGEAGGRFAYGGNMYAMGGPEEKLLPVIYNSEGGYGEGQIPLVSITPTPEEQEAILRKRVLEKAMRDAYANSVLGKVSARYPISTGYYPPIIGEAFGEGTFGGGGAGGRWSSNYTPYYNDEWQLLPVEQTFNDAYSNARSNGQKTFEFNGNTYSTDYAPNVENWKELGDSRTETIGFVKRKKGSHKAGVKRSHASGGYLAGEDYEMTPDEYNRMRQEGYDMSIIHDENESNSRYNNLNKLHSMVDYVYSKPENVNADGTLNLKGYKELVNLQ